MTRYLKVCPRGFANEVTYYAVPDDEVDAAGSYDWLYEQGGYAEWTRDTVAREPGVAVAWVDRHW